MLILRMSRTRRWFQHTQEWGARGYLTPPFAPRLRGCLERFACFAPQHPLSGANSMHQRGFPNVDRPPEDAIPARQGAWEIIAREPPEAPRALLSPLLQQRNALLPRADAAGSRIEITSKNSRCDAENGGRSNGTLTALGAFGRRSLRPQLAACAANGFHSVLSPLWASTYGGVSSLAGAPSLGLAALSTGQSWRPVALPYWRTTSVHGFPSP